MVPALGLRPIPECCGGKIPCRLTKYEVPRFGLSCCRIDYHNSLVISRIIFGWVSPVKGNSAQARLTRFAWDAAGSVPLFQAIEVTPESFHVFRAKVEVRHTAGVHLRQRVFEQILHLFS